MNYYDRWDDRNREAEREGRRHGERGYGYDWNLKTDYWSERGAAYRSGMREGEHARARMEERRQEEEEAERRVREQARRREEEEYEEGRYSQMQENPNPPDECDLEQEPTP